MELNDDKENYEEQQYLNFQIKNTFKLTKKNQKY
jgi:hypothetical protein